jgi:C-terminal processing protease CtpA/Prc
VLVAFLTDAHVCDGQLFIARIIAGGAAHKTGLLNVDDQVLAINDADVSKKPAGDVAQMLKVGAIVSECV